MLTLGRHLCCVDATGSRYTHKCNLIYAPYEKYGFPFANFHDTHKYVIIFCNETRKKSDNKCGKGGQRSVRRDLHCPDFMTLVTPGVAVRKSALYRILSKSDENCGNADKTSLTP
jgi:hypothetical protein